MKVKQREVPLKKYKITIQEHQEYGGLGLVVDTERGYFDPAIDGLIVAHDILEHPIRPHSCGYTDELMALGGYLAGRVEMRYKTNGYKYASIDDIGYDIFYLLKAALIEDGDNNPITKIDKCRSYIKCEWTMNKLRELVKKGILDAINEWMDEDVDDIDSMNGGYDSRVDDYDIDSIVGWICKGHNLFNKRFNNINTYDLFDNIRKVSDNFLSNQIEGMSGTLFVEFSTGNVYIEEDYLD
jgi:hypothetical protein